MNTEKNIIKLLADHIGVEPEDIKPEDFFFEDLHMSPADLSDFLDSLSNIGIDITKIDLATIETVEDLLETLVTQLEYE
ncbi:MAG: acyl carrier protein [Candidatus Microgenomates bacterium]|jgi:acyl carrier protein